MTIFNINSGFSMLHNHDIGICFKLEYGSIYKWHVIVKAMVFVKGFLKTTKKYRE